MNLKKLNTQLLFNSETNFYPNYPIDYFQNAKAHQDEIKQTKYAYLNSGCWIGTTNFCKDLFNRCRDIRLWEKFDCVDYLKLYDCDQSVIHGVLKQHPQITLDYQTKIFNNISLIDASEIAFETKIF